MSTTSKTVYTIPPLVSGGVMLSYQCSSECKHCLYRCSPRKPNEWMTPQMMERVFEALAREKRLYGIHLAGGEPFLRPDLLEAAIHTAIEHRVPIDYVETNAFWATDPDRAHSQLLRMKKAGLSALLISVSMFHNEFIPFSRTRNCVQAATDVFGRENVIVYLPQMYEALSQFDDDGVHTLAEFCEKMGLPPRTKRLRELYDLIPGGRVVDSLREYYDAQPADAFKDCRCGPNLLSVTHFHIDQHGYLFTGCCAGMSAASADNLHPEITPETHPIFCMLVEGGPYGLMKFAMERHGFRPREEGYISTCDLCIDVRRFLLGTRQYPELKPAEFYE